MMDLITPRMDLMKARSYPYPENLYHAVFGNYKPYTSKGGVTIIKRMNGELKDRYIRIIEYYFKDELSTVRIAAMENVTCARISQIIHKGLFILRQKPKYHKWMKFTCNQITIDLDYESNPCNITLDEFGISSEGFLILLDYGIDTVGDLINIGSIGLNLIHKLPYEDKVKIYKKLYRLGFELKP